MLSGEIQSGLAKMILIGLGKCSGATLYHRAFADFGFAEIVADAVPRVLASAKLLGGLGVVENAYDETARVEAVLPEAILERETELLKAAIEWMPRLPFEDAHLLLIDQIGKEISGSGMDTNVTGAQVQRPTRPSKGKPRVSGGSQFAD